MAQFLQVCEDIGEEAIEIPSESDGTLLLTTLQAQFPGACGLKYKSETGAYRGIRLAEGILYPPDGLWGANQFIAVFPKSAYIFMPSQLLLILRLGLIFIIIGRPQNLENQLPSEKHENRLRFF